MLEEQAHHLRERRIAALATPLELVLEEDQLTIGRSADSGLVIRDDYTSTHHARLMLWDDVWMLQDLDSTNGSFVNGEKIKRARLQEGDRILIGTSIIKLVATDSSVSPGDPKARLEDVAQGRRTSQVRTMSGSIAEIPLPDLMQLFSASKKSGVLVIRTDADVGKIFIDNGRVIFAVVNEHYDVAPLKSLFRILTWQTGNFDMDPPEQREFMEQIEMSTEGILMEAMRQIDEVRRLGDDMPPMQASVLLAMPMIPPLRDLSPEELDVLQLAYNYGHVETCLNKSLASDLDTSQILVKLIKSGYLRVE